MPNRISFNIRDMAPCKDCKERFLACSDKCPKDARGEFGYKAWKAEINRVNEEREKYKRLSRRRRWTYKGEKYGG